MAYAGARWHHAEVAERALTPPQERIALVIALELAFDVRRNGTGSAEVVNHHGVIDHQIDRYLGIDPLLITAHGNHRVAHGRQIDHRRNTGKILHQHTRRAERDLCSGTPVSRPIGDRPRIVDSDRAVILVAQNILQEHFK